MSLWFDILKLSIMRKAPLIDTRTDELFTPKAKMRELVGNDKEKYMDLLVTKRLTKATSRSFIFSSAEIILTGTKSGRINASGWLLKVKTASLSPLRSA